MQGELTDEMIAHTSQLNLPLELLVPQHLPADRIPPRILHHRLLLPRLRVPLEPNHTSGEALLEEPRVLAQNGLLDIDKRKQPVARRSDRRELGVVLANALDAVHLELDLLARTELGEEDVGVGGADGVVLEPLCLETDGVERDVRGVHVAIDVRLGRVGLGFGGGGVGGAGDVEAEDDGVFVGGVFALWLGVC